MTDPHQIFKVQQSAKKLMAKCCSDFMLHGQTVNSVKYCETLDKLKEVVH